MHISAFRLATGQKSASWEGKQRQSNLVQFLAGLDLNGDRKFMEIPYYFEEVFR